MHTPLINNLFGCTATTSTTPLVAIPMQLSPLIRTTMETHSYYLSRLAYWKNYYYQLNMARATLGNTILSDETIESTAGCKAEEDFKRQQAKEHTLLLHEHIHYTAFLEDIGLAFLINEYDDRQQLITDLSTLQEQLGSAIAALNNHPSNAQP